MVFTLSFAGAQVTLSEKGAGFVISGIRHFPDGHIEAEVCNFSGKIIITAEESSAKPMVREEAEGGRLSLSNKNVMVDEEAEAKRQLSTDKNSDLGVKQPRKNPEKSSPQQAFLKNLEELQAYKDEHGRTHVPRGENKRLASFVSNIRGAQRLPGHYWHVLTKEHIKLLDDLGFSWGANNKPPEDFDAYFTKRLDELRAFKEEHGHVAPKDTHNRILAIFCNKVRKARGNTEGDVYFKLTEDHISSLDELGFEWCDRPSERSNTKSFAEYFEALKEYRQTHGHLNIERKENRSLFEFCRSLRYKRTNPDKNWTYLTKERVGCLDAIGFQWDGPQRPNVAIAFADRIEELKRFKEAHGHLNVKQKKDPLLYVLCNNIRTSRNNPGKYFSLTEDHIASLDAIGFQWTKREFKSFEERVEDLKRYYEETGSFYVKRNKDPSLYAFVGNLRRARTNPGSCALRLTPDRIATLDAIGFQWDRIATLDAMRFQWGNQQKAKSVPRKRGSL